MIHLLFGAVAAAVGALVAGAVIAVTLSQAVTETVANWLAAQRLSAGHLTNAWMRIERAGMKFRSTVYLQHRDLDRTHELVVERLVTPDQIDDPALRAQLQSSGAATTNIMHLVQ